MSENNDLDFYILSRAPFPVLVINPDTTLRFVNSQLEKLTGFSYTELIGRKAPYPWWRQKAYLETSAHFSRAMNKETKGQEELFRAKDGKLFWVRINTIKYNIKIRNREVEYFVSDWLDVTAQKNAEEALKKARDELELRVIERTADLMAVNVKLHRQITRRKKADKELFKSREQLRDLSIHLQSVREEERTNVAREIHDELGQSLTALYLNSSWLYNHLPKEQALFRNKVKSMMEIIDSTIKAVKRLSTELRPGLLDDLGIIAAIEWQANKFQDTTGIKCYFSSVLGGASLDKERRTAIFRIFQETLTNVARHANATLVRVLLEEKHTKVILRIRDNGIGITEEQISAHKSLGILGMRERARAFGGEIKIKGTQGRGTTVTLSIPANTKDERQ